MMSKTAMWIIGVVVVIGVILFGYFWMKGKQAETEMKQKAGQAQPTVTAPAPAAPTEK